MAEMSKNVAEMRKKCGGDEKENVAEMRKNMWRR